MFRMAGLYLFLPERGFKGHNVPAGGKIMKILRKLHNIIRYDNGHEYCIKYRWANTFSGRRSPSSSRSLSSSGILCRYSVSFHWLSHYLTHMRKIMRIIISSIIIIITIIIYYLLSLSYHLAMPDWHLVQVQRILSRIVTLSYALLYHQW